MGVRVLYLDTPSFMALKVRQWARCHNCGVKGNNKNQEVLTLLLDAGADATAVNEDGETPFDLAKDKEHW